MQEYRRGNGTNKRIAASKIEWGALKQKSRVQKKLKSKGSNCGVIVQSINLSCRTSVFLRIDLKCRATDTLPHLRFRPCQYSA